MDMDMKSSIRSVFIPVYNISDRMTRGNRKAHASVTHRDTSVTLSPSVWFKLENCTLVTKLLGKFYFDPQNF